MKTERSTRKKEEQAVRQLNKSVKMLSKQTFIELGLAGIQEDDNIFYLGNCLYSKIYSLSVPFFGDQRIVFVQRLLETTENRVRVSMFRRNMEQKKAAYTFLTVYVHASCYADAREQLQQMDNIFIANKCCGLGIETKACTIDNVLTFTHMNCTGEIIRYAHSEMTSDKDNWAEQLFPKLEETTGGRFKCGKNYGVCFGGKVIPFGPNDINNILLMKEGIIQITVDLQKIPSEEEAAFRSELERKYNSPSGSKKFELVNLAYMTIYMSGEEAIRDREAADLERKFDDRGFLMMPGAGKEKDIFYSICSLGIKDYHVMYNSYPSIAGNLLK